MVRLTHIQVLQNEDGIYLIERFIIAYAPSLTTLWSIQHRSLYDGSFAAKTSKQKPESPKVIYPNAKADKLLWTGLGVSTFDGKLEPLPYAREEARQIASLVKQARPKMPIRFARDKFFASGRTPTLHFYSDGAKGALTLLEGQGS